MNPYTKKYLEFLETNDDPDVKFTEKHKPPMFLYKLWALEEINKKNILFNMKDALDNNEFNNTEFQVFQDVHNEKLKRKEDKKPFVFITINPKPDADFNDFKINIEDIATWSWVDKCYWVFEQRGSTESEMGRGFHSHIIIEKYNIAVNKIKSQVKNKFKKFVGVCNDHTINVQKKQRDWLEDKLEYIMGKKYDEGKPEKQEIDIIWREKNSLKPYYTFDTLTDKKRVSNNKGGRREGSGVKKGTKRGKYNEKKIVNTNENKISEITFEKKKKTLTF